MKASKRNFRPTKFDRIYFLYSHVNFEIGSQLETPTEI